MGTGGKQRLTGPLDWTPPHLSGHCPLHLNQEVTNTCGLVPAQRNVTRLMCHLTPRSHATLLQASVGRVGC
jgi:hypothetical protein